MNGNVCALFYTFLETVLQKVNTQMPEGPMQTDVRNSVMSFIGVALSEKHICDYFEHPPAHVAAVNTLDHTQFTGPLVVFRVGCSAWRRLTMTSPGGSFPLTDVLGVCSKFGPVHYGEVWLALVNVAEAANPTAINSSAIRAYLRQQARRRPTDPRATDLDRAGAPQSGPVERNHGEHPAHARVLPARCVGTCLVPRIVGDAA